MVFNQKNNFILFSFLVEIFGFRPKKFDFWPKISIFRPKIEKIFNKSFFWFQIWNLRPRKPPKMWKFGQKICGQKKVAFGRKCFGRVYLASLAQIEIFTHPIFESDFDCLTGKNRLHANSLLSPLASDKN
mgnify:CR=1 FL=1